MSRLLLVTAVEDELQYVLKHGVTFNGYSQGEKVVLCSTVPYFLGVGAEWLDVWFVKPLSEVYIDIDDDTDFPIPTLPLDGYLKRSLKELNITEIGTYGLFVRKVNPDEIIRIDKVTETQRRVIYWR